VAMIAEASGMHFDPRVVEAFLQIQDRFHEIWQQFHTVMPVSQDAGQDAAESEFAADAAARFDEFTTSLHQTGQ
jgi:HD-GYP domain-containing protein (c-di-GMP phosphodiesterase class II)